ncbi:MAG TPA: TetR/AcrR family transcriptional regulator [Chloroflexota bacterium]|nr:TetR/AcrR family transcriptional regulator [Chloroflexota bacterium]
MARTVNEREFTRKRNEILEAAMRLVLAKGYERMTIQDILTDLRISSGAFYHYFGSKPALLEAFIEQIGEVAEQPLLPIINDPHLSAIEKLRGFFGVLSRLVITHSADVAELGPVWFTDENAIVRQKVDEATARQRVPMLAAIVRQGIQEGVFTTPYPDLAGEVVHSLLQGMQNAHAGLLRLAEQDGSEAYPLEDIVTSHSAHIVTTCAAYMDAIERVLGAPPNSLHRVGAEEVAAWAVAARGTYRA